MRDAAIEVYRRRRVLYPAIILPIVGLLLLSWLPHAYYATSTISIIVVGLAGLPFYVALATTCHRVILLGEDSLPNRFGVFWSKRETLFLGQLLILGLIAAAIAVPIWALISILAISGFADLDRETIIATVFGVSILSAYVDGRFGLILPATAIGERTSLGR
jgi:hypothetical protein